MQNGTTDALGGTGMLAHFVEWHAFARLRDEQSALMERTESTKSVEIKKRIMAEERNASSAFILGVSKHCQTRLERSGPKTYKDEFPKAEFAATGV
jgi:hypothetical protein